MIKAAYTNAKSSIIYNTLNQCEECGSELLQSADGTCTECGLKQRINTIHMPNEEGKCLIKIGGKMKGYNVIANYSKQQKKNIEILMYNCWEGYKKTSYPEIPEYIVCNVIQIYNELQQLIVHGYKFIRRGNVKTMVLGALLYYNCLNSGIAITRNHILCFMGVEKKLAGFSPGEKKIRQLVMNGFLNLNINIETYPFFIKRYCEALNIKDEIKTVTEIYECAEQYMVGYTKKMRSKIAGIVWLICSHKYKHITQEAISYEIDGTTISTFVKFYRLLIKTYPLYNFDKYDIKIFTHQPYVYSA